MPNPPPRKFFQIHLSTAIVLMFVAAGLIWANMSAEEGCVASSRGWPYHFYTAPYGHAFDNLSIGHFINVYSLIVDLIIAALTICITWIVCKKRIVQRTVRKLIDEMPSPQVRLSTAILMMFVSGVLIWANVSGQRVLRFGKIVNDKILEHYEPECTVEEFLRGTTWGNWTVLRWQSYGWPWAVQTSFSYNIIESKKENVTLPAIRWSNFNMVLDVLSATTTLFSVWYLSEWLIRRRAKRKEA